MATGSFCVKETLMQHYVFRSTTDKLPEHMQHIVESGDSVVGEPTFIGGRDWVILARKGGPSVVDLTVDQLVVVLADAVVMASKAIDIARLEARIEAAVRRATGGRGGGGVVR